MKKNQVDSFLRSGVQFDEIPFVIEFFQMPLPLKINDTPIRSKHDLFRMSHHEGFSEIFYTDKEYVSCKVGKSRKKVSQFDFLSWQLARFEAKDLFYLRDKVDADILNILDDDSEYDRDSDYAPESWLDAYNDNNESIRLGLAYIERLRAEHPEALYTRLIDAMNDEGYGVLAHFDMHINDNIKAIRAQYKEWSVPLMIISEGAFLPYIEANSDFNLMMDDYRLDSMWVRNNDEG